MKNNVEVNVNNLNTRSKEYDLSFEDYSEIILYHELGHALDPKLEILTKEINDCFNSLMINGFDENVLNTIKKHRIEAEKNAWEIAQTYTKPNLINKFMEIRNEALEYTISIEELQKQQIILLFELNESKNYVELLKDHIKESN
jgi:hypothetical protein